ncbi:hypothetical protein [Microbacterium sp. PM5]|uniref:hypothetical protein n=1 Tax=Microbacterium sp. PM5 TaxID=2014534 RepID=UPI000DD0F59B|nr:hypothetical protein [Microbacterium sp. PM5]AXA95440.1 hypothetical protein CEP17_02850 [Microbacterium sp. PM5]
MSNIDLISAPIGGQYTYTSAIEDALRAELVAVRNERSRCEQEAINLRRLLNAVLATKGTDGVITLSDEQWVGADLSAVIRTEYDARYGGRTSIWAESGDPS